MRFLERGQAFFLGMAALFLLFSILCRFMTGVILKRLLREAENMSATKDRTLRQCKLKFQSCYELNKGCVNTRVFVEKFMQGLRAGKCSLRFLELLSGQLLLLSVFSDGLGACVGLACKKTLGQVLPCYVQALFSLYLHFVLAGLIDVAGKREAVKVTVTDFLENRMPVRIDRAKADSAYLEEEEKKAAKAAGKEGGNAKQEGELESLLREFLA